MPRAPLRPACSISPRKQEKSHTRPPIVLPSSLAGLRCLPSTFVCCSLSKTFTRAALVLASHKSVRGSFFSAWFTSCLQTNRQNLFSHELQRCRSRPLRHSVRRIHHHLRHTSHMLTQEPRAKFLPYLDPLLEWKATFSDGVLEECTLECISSMSFKNEIEKKK
jgi:hypothetical protein